MYLEFTYGDINWTYNNFMAFKNKLLSTLGYTCPLLVMYKDGTYSRMKKESIYPLLDCSNCNDLTIEEMREILPQLKEIVERWQNDDCEKLRGEQLIKCMESTLNRAN